MANIFRLLLLGLLCLSSLAHAALPKEGRYFYYSLSEANGSYDFMAACQIAIGNEGGGATFHSITGSPPGQGCRFLYGDGRGPFTAALQRTPRFVCPDNTVENSSGTCDCQSGYREEAGQCVTKNDHAQQCWMFAGLETLGGGVLTTDVTLKGDIAHGASLCYPLEGEASKGCTVTFNRSSMATWSDGTKVSYGSYDMTPATKTFGNNQPDYSCASNSSNTPTENATSTGEKCSGYVGSVNGVETCVPGTSSATGVDINGGGSTTTNSDGSSSASQSNTNCTSTTCTTTTTTTTTAAGGGTSTSTSTTTQSSSAYCAGAGASAAVCGGGGGGGDGPVGSVGGGKTHGQPDLYESKYPNGIKGVWEASGVAGGNGKFGALVSALMPSFTDSNGACLSFQVPLSVGFFDFGSIDVSPPCIVWPFIRICILISALWLCRALIFGG